MNAVSSSSGGVIFVPEKLERQVKPTKYSEFVEEENAKEKIGVFGKKKAAKTAKGGKKVA